MHVTYTGQDFTPPQTLCQTLVALRLSLLGALLPAWSDHFNHTILIILFSVTLLLTLFPHLICGMTARRKKVGWVCLWTASGVTCYMYLLRRFCNRDVKLLVIRIRLYYLLREFTSVIAITVYIPPSGKADVVISSVTAPLQTKHLGAFIFIMGDFTSNLSPVCQMHHKRQWKTGPISY